MHTLIKKTSLILLTVALVASCSKKTKPDNNQEEEHHHHHGLSILLGDLGKVTLTEKKIKNSLTKTNISNGEASLQETERGHFYTLTAKESVLKEDTAIIIKITTEKGAQLSVKNRTGRPKTNFALLSSLTSNTEKDLKADEQNLTLETTEAYVVIQKGTDDSGSGKRELIIVAKNNQEDGHVHLVIDVSS